METTETKKFGASLKKCTCTHEFQDETYGTKVRVHTKGLKAATCTVCGATKPIK